MQLTFEELGRQYADLAGKAEVKLFDGKTRELRAYIVCMEYSGNLSPRDECNATTLVLFRRWYGLSRYLDETGDNYSAMSAYEHYVHEGADYNKPSEDYSGVPSQHPSLRLVTGHDSVTGVAFRLHTPTGDPQDIDEIGDRADYFGFAWINSDDVPEEQWDTVIQSELNVYGLWLRGEVYEYVIVDDTGEVHDSVCGFYYTLNDAEAEHTREQAREALADVVARYPDEYRKSTLEQAARLLASLPYDDRDELIRSLE